MPGPASDAYARWFNFEASEYDKTGPSCTESAFVAGWIASERYYAQPSPAPAPSESAGWRPVARRAVYELTRARGAFEEGLRRAAILRTETAHFPVPLARELVDHAKTLLAKVEELDGSPPEVAL